MVLLFIYAMFLLLVFIATSLNLAVNTCMYSSIDLFTSKMYNISLVQFLKEVISLGSNIFKSQEVAGTLRQIKGQNEDKIMFG